MIIYKATNNINGKIYVGQTTLSLEERKKYHKISSKTQDTYFYRAIRKYGWENFSWEIIDETAKTEDELDMLEEHYIALFDCFDNKEVGYNCQSGGKRFRITEEERKNRSERAKGSKNPMYQKYPHKGKKFSQEHKDRISKSLIGREHPTTKGGNNPSAKKIINITTNTIYDCIRDANKALGLKEKSHSIQDSIKNNTLCCNCKFDFYDETKDYSKENTEFNPSNKSRKRIIDDEGNIYTSIAKAAEAYGCSRKVVREVCNGLREDYNGKIWKHYIE